jgi:putative phage-type endonuclease
MGVIQSVGEIDRQRYLGGSDVAGILGLSPWRTALDVYLDKVEGKQPDDPSKAKIFRRGSKMEPYILDLLTEEHGIQIVSRGQRYRDQQHEFIAAEIDAEAATGENIEVKTANQFAAKNWGEQFTDEIPVYYTAQAMHGMMVRPAPATIFPVLIGSDDFRVYRVERDDETIEAIRAKEVEFWDRVVRRDPPPATTVSDVIRLFERDSGTGIEADDDILVVFNKLKDIKKRIKVDEADAEEAEKLIKLYLGEHSTLQFGAKKLCTWKSQDTSRFDQTAFAEKHPAIFERFKKTTTSRVFRVK